MTTKVKGATEEERFEEAVVVPDIPFPSCRFVLALLAFFGFFAAYALRVNLSVALVGMVNSSYTDELEKSEDDEANVTEVDECGPFDHNKTKKHTGEFNWNSHEQGIILAAFFYGYIVTQIPGGILAERVGGKILLQLGILCTAIFTVLTPAFTQFGGFAGIVIARVLEGLGEGVTYPAMHAMLSIWAPPLERSKMVTFVYAGAQIGTVVGMPASGLLCEYVSWQSVFYVLGAVGIVWAVLWWFFVYDSPEKHPRITTVELNYITKSMGDAHQKHKASPPWLKFATSLPVYAVAVGHFTNNWGYYTLLTCLPQYLKHILHFDMKSNGFIAGLPYLVLWFVMIASGFCADLLRTKRVMSTTKVRKLFCTIGFIGPGVCLVATGYIKCNAALAVLMIVLSLGLSGISWGGWSVNHLDLAPDYAGTLMGITNAVATIPGFLGPTVVGVFTYKNQTRAAWRNVFFLSGAIYLFGTIFFLLFGSGELQKWAMDTDSSAAVDHGSKGTPLVEVGAEKQSGASKTPEEKTLVESKT